MAQRILAALRGSASRQRHALFAYAACLLTLSAATAFGQAVDQAAHLLKDFNPAVGGSSDPGHFISTGKNAYFFTRAPGYVHCDLWSTDGTEGGTHRIDRSADEGKCVDFATGVSGRLLMVRHDGIWVSDAAAPGRHLLIPDRRITEVVARVAGGVLLKLYDRAVGTELWWTDGVRENTRFVTHLAEPNETGPPPLIPARRSSGDDPRRNATEEGLDSTLIVLPDRFERSVLWRTDGTREGSTPIYVTDARIDTPRLVNGSFYFVVHTGAEANPCQLWRTDGTSEGIEVISHASPCAFDSPVAVGNVIFFIGADPSGGPDARRTVWRTDNTEVGTSSIPSADAAASYNYVERLVAADGALYFTATVRRSTGSGSTSEFHVWSSDGFRAWPVTEGIVDPSSAGLYSSDPVPVGRDLLFTAMSAEEELHLWRTDGTPEGTFILKETNPGRTSSAYWLHAFRDGALLKAASAEHGEELWTSDGTPGGTRLVKDLLHVNQDSNVRPLGEIGDRLLFTVNGGLWVTDGTEATTVFLGPAPHQSGGFLGDLYFYTLKDSSPMRDGDGIWRTDGTPEGTYRITTDWNFGWGSYRPMLDDGSRDASYFCGRQTTPPYPYVLLQTDGTTDGTAPFLDAAPWGDCAEVQAIVNGVIFLLGWDYIFGLELWRTDGTAAGTWRIEDFEVDPSRGESTELSFYLTPHGIVFFMPAADREELRRLDLAGRTSERLLRGPRNSIWPGSGLNGKVYFGVASDDGFELWRSDGSRQGTVPLGPQGLGRTIAAGPFLYFSASIYGELETELWRIDTDTDSLSLVMDGFFQSGLHFSHVQGNFVYFFAERNGDVGLWRTDGSTTGTARVAPMSTYSMFAGGKVYFRESTEEFGAEFWVLPNVLTCGNGVIDGTEQCDDGNFVAGDGCDPSCVPTGCGNGFVTNGEGCDDRNHVPTDGCAYCQPAVCGDGIRQSALEECDDGNETSGDGCDVNCTLSRCGNSVKGFDEECDQGDRWLRDGCSQECGLCGNGTVSPGEECDDGNQSDGDGCDSNCTLTRCGNGIANEGEACDDGNSHDGDGCRMNCTLPVCGDGVADPLLEECDDGNVQDGDGCDSNCRATGCGNGIITQGEECDQGSLNGTFDCSMDCSACGNGITSGSEECDDANSDDSDGCTNRCTVCGDGVAESKKRCDDGNLEDGDGCDSNCTRSGCGNGIVTSGETCDDGGVVGGACASGCEFDSIARECVEGLTQAQAKVASAMLVAGQKCQDRVATGKLACEANTCVLDPGPDAVILAESTCESAADCCPQFDSDRESRTSLARVEKVSVRARSSAVDSCSQPSFGLGERGEGVPASPMALGFGDSCSDEASEMCSGIATHSLVDDGEANDLVDCINCATDSRSATLMRSYYPKGSALSGSALSCQKTIGMRTRKLATKSIKLESKCVSRAIFGNIACVENRCVISPSTASETVVDGSQCDRAVDCCPAFDAVDVTKTTRARIRELAERNAAAFGSACSGAASRAARMSPQTLGFPMTCASTSLVCQLIPTTQFHAEGPNNDVADCIACNLETHTSDLVSISVPAGWR